MIKIFGKLRYHWQPELSFSIIYWCLSFVPIFISLALLYENTKISTSSFIFFIIFIILLGIGIHRYFVISDDEDELRIYSSVPGLPKKIKISSIKKIDVSKHTLIIYTDKWKDGKIFYMKKWTKKYFLDTLAVNKFFKGEVDIVGNAGQYFEYYQDNRKKKTRSN